MGYSSATAAGTCTVVEKAAGHRRKVWNVVFFVVRSHVCVVVCFHLQEAAVNQLDNIVFKQLLPAHWG